MSAVIIRNNHGIPLDARLTRQPCSYLRVDARIVKGTARRHAWVGVASMATGLRPEDAVAWVMELEWLWSDCLTIEPAPEPDGLLARRRWRNPPALPPSHEP